MQANLKTLNLLLTQIITKKNYSKKFKEKKQNSKLEFLDQKLETLIIVGLANRKS